MMILTRIAAAFAIATLGACASLPVGRDFSKLTVGERVDYYTCVFSDVGSGMTPRGNSAGAMLDSLLSKGSRIQDTARSAAQLCAVKQFIDPNTIPGLR
jgi:hypothetical protein